MNGAKQRFAAALWALAALGAGAAFLLAPARSAQGFWQGLALCAGSVLPALFPFFVVCNLLCASPAALWLSRPLRPLTRLCGIPEEAAPLALALSWLGGYAVCARTLGQMRRQGTLCRASAARLLLLGCCAGPGFAIGCMGGLMLGSVRAGVLLYALQLAANLLTAACILPFLKAGTDAVPPQPQPAPAAGLSAAIGGAVDSSLQVCGCTLFFCVLAAQLRPALPAWAPAWPLLGMVLELSTGSAAFAAVGGAWALHGMALCLSWPGVSILCQMRALLGRGAPMGLLAAARVLHAVWLQALLCLLARCLPGAVAAYSSLAARVIPMNRLPPDAAAVCFVFLCCALYKLRQTFYNRGDSAQ